MNGAPETQVKSYVIVPIGNRRFSLAAESVVELIATERLQKFPHGTPWISGVIVRRNRIVPVCDVEQLLGERNESIDRFHLIAEWRDGGSRDWCAIPVAGECEIASALTTVKPVANRETPEPYMVGSIQVGEDYIQILDLARIIQEWRMPPDVNRGPQ